MAIVPRGGGTGFAAGAVPDGGVVVSLERMTRVRAFDPLLWRIHVEAGLSTAEVRRLARENGLFFPPDPGAAEQSQIGGNIATNAGGPHAFKYGATGAWVTGLEAVVPPGEMIELGGAIRKDVAGYDLKGLLIGSEGTLGVITAAWLKLLPAPEATLPVVGLLRRRRGRLPCDRGGAGRRSGSRPRSSTWTPAPWRRRELVPGRDPGGRRLHGDRRGRRLHGRGGAPPARAGRGLGRRRARRPSARAATRGGGAVALARRRFDCGRGAARGEGERGHRRAARPAPRRRSRRPPRSGAATRLEACSWGHAGDGNLHSTFLVAPDDAAELERARAAAEELFELAVRLGGSISGEHGIGWLKRGQLARQWPPRALELHEAVKRAFDPKGLMNPGKKAAS